MLAESQPSDGLSHRSLVNTAADHACEAPLAGGHLARENNLAAGCRPLVASGKSAFRQNDISSIMFLILRKQVVSSMSLSDHRKPLDVTLSKSVYPARRPQLHACDVRNRSHTINTPDWPSYRRCCKTRRCRFGSHKVKRPLNSNATSRAAPSVAPIAQHPKRVRPQCFVPELPPDDVPKGFSVRH
ncbi:uncharacterized protein LY79DRAFT_31318 [Colletotrichum navitas]|uniref:Uncharacterized protein n=1 Tax=Colletotrichum navitas TaxID=681940 RepID=A0AAD8V8Z1_9PEZI|nr:uncharacterized protein LY79DRAFT_31318 [Colletotrichum navitas]KAK1596793.1 hypothetical protein LY79DRAFT_31318 [Colletotrichum navitas]